MNYSFYGTAKSIFATIFGLVKRFAAIGFIFLLSAQCIFKLGIITYFQANQEYIAQVLCINKEKPITMCHGQCFLDRNLALADEEMPQQAPAPGKVKIENTIFLGLNVDIQLSMIATEISQNPSPETLYTFVSGRTFFHPPC
jgi:hypothetical protein